MNKDKCYIDCGFIFGPGNHILLLCWGRNGIILHYHEALLTQGIIGIIGRASVISWIA